MNQTIVHWGEIIQSENGKVIIALEDFTLMNAWIKSIGIESKVIIRIDKPPKKITNDQYAFLFGVIAPVLLTLNTFSGWTTKEVVNHLLNEISPEIRIVINKYGVKKPVQKTPDIKKFPREKMTEFIGMVIEYIREEYDIILPPNKNFVNQLNKPIKER